MSVLQVDLLEQSFDLIAPRGEELVAAFYRRLFLADPALQSLFVRTNMVTQRRMLLAALVLVRTSLRDPGRLGPVLVALGARHQGYGVRPEHYDRFGATVLATMAPLGGAAWRAEYTAAWAVAYQAVRDAMLRGAEAAAGAMA